MVLTMAPVARCDDCKAKAEHDRDHRKSDRRRSLEPPDYTLSEVGARDGWRCHLCNKKVRRDLSGDHPDGPTIDHLVPVSDRDNCRNTAKNVALAHRRCNIKRSNRGPAQLRLIA